MRFPLLLLLAVGIAGPAGLRAEEPPRLPVGDTGGVARLLPLPGAAALAPLVLLLPDAAGEQGRAESYVDALAARGVASLVLDIDDGTEGIPSTGEGALAALRGLGAPVAVIGFGAGARAALAAGRGPVVALDPGCVGLGLPPGREVLLVHGLAAPDAAACASLGVAPGLTRLALPGIGHGWDLPPVLAPGGALLADPAGPGLRRARP
ncbi:hypothetical protein, partial [Neoroseomonas soli]